jgi:2-polyprenyl-6-hydroxyphenyl methylase/3-demethylubiquinone-9 3-methyltransferase
MARKINNAFYDSLGQGWYEEKHHPIALLRAENAVRMPWIIKVLQERFGKQCKFLDIGCGGGLLCNPLAQEGFQVTGIDLSLHSLHIAKKQDTTKSAQYIHASAYELPFLDQSFDAVCALDLLEHVEDPQKVIQEASRVLKKGGLFFFHTFNRNFFSWLLVIKGVEWVVPNTPERMHVYPLFIKPKELTLMCKNASIHVKEMHGLKPQLSLSTIGKMWMTKKIPEDFSFAFSSSTRTGFLGYGLRD